MFQQRVAPWLSGDSGVKMLFRKGPLALGVKQKEATERKQQKEQEVEQRHNLVGSSRLGLFFLSSVVLLLSFSFMLPWLGFSDGT